MVVSKIIAPRNPRIPSDLSTRSAGETWGFHFEKKGEFFVILAIMGQINPILRNFNF